MGFSFKNLGVKKLLGVLENLFCMLRFGGGWKLSWGFSVGSVGGGRTQTEKQTRGLAE